MISPVTPFSAAPGQPREQLREAAQQFEAIFLRQMLSSAKAADFGGDELFGGTSDDTFRDMRDAQFADLAAKTGSIGLASSLEAQLSRFVKQG